MAVTTTPREEERAAKERTRQLEKARKAAAKVRDREARGKRADIIREELAKPRASHCRCGLRASMTAEDLLTLEEGCTGSRHRGGYSYGFICPVLDTVRRRL